MTSPRPEPPQDPLARAASHGLESHTEATSSILDYVVDAVREFLRAVRASVLGSGRPDLDQYPDDTVWNRLYDSYVDPVANRVYQAAAAYAGGERPAGPLARRVRENAPGRLPAQLYDAVQGAVRAGLDAGEGVPGLTARVEAVLDDPQWTGWRAQRMARTEATGMLNAGTFAGAFERAAADGTVDTTRKQWLGIPDSRIRDTHLAAHLQTQPLIRPFLVGDASLMFPGAPDGPVAEIVDCRCTMIIIRPGQDPLVLLPDMGQPVTASAEGETVMCQCKDADNTTAVLSTLGGLPVAPGQRAAVSFADGTTRDATVESVTATSAALKTDDGAVVTLPLGAIAASVAVATVELTGGEPVIEPAALTAAVAAGVTQGLAEYAGRSAEIDQLSQRLRAARPAAPELGLTVKPETLPDLAA